MPRSSTRKTLELPADLLAELQADAKQLRISPTALATLLLSEALQRRRAVAQIPHRVLAELTPDLTAQIVAEGMPSPTLAALARAREAAYVAELRDEEPAL